MILDESLFEEVKAGDVRGSYKKKELSDEQLFDKVFEKLQSKIIAKHYKVGTDGDNLYINARVVNKKLPNGRVVIKREFLTDKKDYEDIIKYLDEANVKHEFKDGVQGLKLSILLDKDNAKDVNMDALNRNVRVKKESLPANQFKLKKYNDNPAVIGRSTEDLKELKRYYLGQVKKYNDMKAYDEARWYQKQADWCDRELAEKENISEDLQYLSKEEIESGKDRWVKTEEDEKVWNSLSDKDKEFLVLSNDMGFWFDEIKGNEELEDRYEELKSKFSISLKEGFAIIRTIEDAQREVDEQIEKFGRIGGGLYDDLDDAGFYVDENNKVQYKVKPVKEDLNTFDYDKLQKELEAIPNVTKIDFDKDLIYDTKELVVLINWHSDSDNAQWFRDKVAVKTKAIEVFKNNGLRLSDPIEDNGDYYYFVLREITPKAESLKEELSPEQEKEYGLNTLINTLIKSEYDAIDEYNSAIVTFEAEGQGEYTDVIRSIIEDERHHIGNLQEIMNRITPGTSAEFEHGKEEAVETLDEEPKEETTTTIDTEEGVIKTYKLDKVEDMKESLNEELKEYDPEEGWTEEDIELHKSIDWKGRNFERYEVAEDEFKGKVYCYGANENDDKEYTFHKFLRPNPIYPPYYKAVDFDDSGFVGPMYDGRKHGTYGIHDRYETQEVNDRLSEELSNKKLTKEEIKQLALDNFENGGDVVYSAWDDSDIEEFIQEDGTKKGLLDMFKKYHSIYLDGKAAAYDANHLKPSHSEDEEDNSDSYPNDFRPDDGYDKDYGPSNPWDAPGMRVSDFIKGVK